MEPNRGSVEGDWFYEEDQGQSRFGFRIAEHLHSDDVSDWGDRMLELHRRFGVKILGGCCGTNADHLKYIVNHLSAEQKSPLKGT